MDQSDPPLTLREKYAASQARAHLLQEERMLRNEQKPIWVRYVPEFLFWAAALSGLYACGAWIVWPMREMRLSMEQKQALSSPPSAYAYHTANAQYLAGEIQQAASTLLPLLAKHPDSYPANILMARIELGRHQPAAAVKYVEAARQTALDRGEIEGWINELKSSPPAR